MERENEEMTSIHDQAANWWVALHGGTASANEKREFAGWIAQAPAHVEAMIRVARIHKGLARPQVQWPSESVQELIAQAKTGEVETVVALPWRRRESTQTGRRWPATRVAFGLAAALVIAVCLSWFMPAGAQTFETSVGEQRSVMLDDGSRITLNTASRISVRMRVDRRVVDLVKGEALFEVAPDAQRPFDVRFRDVVVRVVGTRFDIDLRETRSTVTVSEGRVAVIPAGARAEDARMLSAGERIVIDASGVKPVEKGVDTREATAWTRNELVFRRRPVGEIAEELNRYTLTRVEIRGDDLKRKEVTGTVRTDELSTFLSLLSGIPGVRITRDSSGGYVVTSDESAASPR